MSFNPYESPTALEPVVGVLSGRREDLRKVAETQRRIIICILVWLVTYLVAIFTQFSLPWPLRLVLAVVFISTGLLSTVFVIQLCIRVYGMGAGILLGVLALVPCINLIVLLVVNGKATTVLRANGIPVGFLGADMSRV